MSETVTIYDNDGTELKIDMHVCYFDEQPVTGEFGSTIGEVIEFTDFDGDVDDETLRSIVINPVVIVKFYRYEHSEKVYFQERYSTSGWEHHATGYDEENIPLSYDHIGECEELISCEYLFEAEQYEQRHDQEEQRDYSRARGDKSLMPWGWDMRIKYHHLSRFLPDGGYALFPRHEL